MKTRAKRNLAVCFALLFVFTIAALSPLYGEDPAPAEKGTSNTKQLLTIGLIIAFLVFPVISGLLQKNDTKPIANPEDFPPCPTCSGKNISKITFGKWEGKIGPKLFNLVLCQDCNTSYNGNNGTLAYVPRVVSQVIFLGIAFAMLFYLIHF